MQGYGGHHRWNPGGHQGRHHDRHHDRHQDEPDERLNTMVNRIVYRVDHAPPESKMVDGHPYEEQTRAMMTELITYFLTEYDIVFPGVYELGNVSELHSLTPTML